MRLLRALPKQALQVLKDGEPTSSGQPVPELKAHAHNEELSLMKWTWCSSAVTLPLPHLLCRCGKSLTLSLGWKSLQISPETSLPYAELHPKAATQVKEWTAASSFTAAAQCAACCWCCEGGSLTAQIAPNLVWIYKVSFHKVYIWKVEYQIKISRTCQSTHKPMAIKNRTKSEF